MLAHYVVRRVMHDAAVVASQDPDRLSFIDSLRVLQCQLPESPHIDTETWYRRLLGEVRVRSSGRAGIGGIRESSNERCPTG